MEAACIKTILMLLLLSCLTISAPIMQFNITDSSKLSNVTLLKVDPYEWKWLYAYSNGQAYSVISVKYNQGKDPTFYDYATAILGNGSAVRAVSEEMNCVVVQDYTSNPNKLNVYMVSSSTATLMREVNQLVGSWTLNQTKFDVGR